MNIPSIAYWTLAVLASVWYGWNAVEIFTNVPNRRKEGGPSTSWYWHQRWLNFIGSFVGWIVLWVLLRKYCCCVLGECSVDPNYWDFFLAFIAFVGITGYLPFAILGLLSGLSGLGLKAADLIKNIFPKPPDKGAG